MNFQHRDDLEAANFRQLAGPYSASETEMLEAVLLDAARANKDVAFSGRPGRVEVWQRSRFLAAA